MDKANTESGQPLAVVGEPPADTAGVKVMANHNGVSYSVGPDGTGAAVTLAGGAAAAAVFGYGAAGTLAGPDTTNGNATNQTAQTPKANFQNLVQQQPNLVGKVLQDALKEVFIFTKLTEKEKQVALQTAGVVGGAVSSTIIPCLFDLTGPFTSVSDQNKFMRTALSGIRANIVTSHFPLLLKQNLGGKNISGPDMQTLLDAMPSAYVGVIGALIQKSFDSSRSSRDKAGNDAEDEGFELVGY